jgi:hypothetical protein
MATSPHRRIQRLITTTDDDRELLEQLEALERESNPWELRRTASHWARDLYARNPETFGGFVERNLDAWGLQQASDLERWLQEAASNRHHRLFRALYRTWLQDTVGWEGMRERWAEDVRRAFREAASRGERRDVLERYDFGFDPEDEDAVLLYEIDPVPTEEWIRDYIERTEWLPASYEKLAAAAREAGNEDFYFFLYRRTFPLDRWRRDVQRLAGEVSDAAELRHELERRHLQGPDASVDPVGLVRLVKERGEDVRPYLRTHVPRCFSWGTNRAWLELAELAAERAWWDVWTVTIRSQFGWQEFNTLIETWLDDTSRPQWETAALLTRIAGTHMGQGEWRRIVHFTEPVGLAFYDRFPELARGPFIDHYVAGFRQTYQNVAARAAESGDTAMVDLLTARALTVAPSWWMRSQGENANLDWYVEHYDALDAEEFPHRALRVVTRVEPFEFMNRRAIRRDNPLYALFFRDVERYRPIAHRVRTLLESPCEATRRLGLRILSLDGVPRAHLARENLDHLLAYLLNQANRSTRIAAFRALARAASADRETGTMVCERARETLDLRCRDYPRNRLIELIGRIVHRWPSLRTEREHPTIYDREVS